jgi:cell fate regulator YaaT (PSP1 superfamily)
MVKVIGVRFKKVGKVYYFDPGTLKIEKDQRVIVETARGVELGEVVLGEKMIGEDEIVSPLKSVMRIATPQDFKQDEENKQKEKSAFVNCLKKINEHSLDMHLIDCEYTFDNNKLLFYFTAEGRIDFRELVKDLAAIYKTRIELRQIGVRDEAKVVGGIGVCGRELCCATFLGEFQPVSIKMAKEQGLSLNPTKISGTCGRLMCCLKYEQGVYEEKIGKVPGAGAIVETPQGEAVVVESNLLVEKIKVRLTKDNDPDLYIYDANEVRIIKDVVIRDDVDNFDELKRLED